MRSIPEPEKGAEVEALSQEIPIDSETLEISNELQMCPPTQGAEINVTTETANTDVDYQSRDISSKYRST